MSFLRIESSKKKFFHDKFLKNFLFGTLFDFSIPRDCEINFSQPKKIIFKEHQNNSDHFVA